MRVEFIKRCPWSFNGRVKIFEKGNFYEASDKDGAEMVGAGYAKLHKESEEIKMPVAYDAKVRFKYYKSFSLKEIQSFCERHKIPLPKMKRVSVKQLAQAIVSFEKTREQPIIEDEINE